MKPIIYLIGAIAAAAIQVYFAGSFIFDRANLLKTGQEVVLNTGFVDPRDLFRGHYVRLRLDIEQLETSNLESFDKIKSGEDVFAELKKMPDGFWTPTRLTATYPDASTGPVIKGRMRYSSSSKININFPINRYFAPKLEALKLEKLRRDRKLGVVVALDDTGEAGIKGITVDGKVIYDEPLF